MESVLAWLRIALRQVRENDSDLRADDWSAPRQRAREIEEPAGSNAVDALLILLILLEGDAENLGKALLAHADFKPARPHALSQSQINGIGGAFVTHGLSSQNIRESVPAGSGSISSSGSRSRERSTAGKC